MQLYPNSSSIQQGLSVSYISVSYISVSYCILVYLYLSSFDCEGKQCTVRDYFKNQYKKELRYPGLPCLHMEGKNNTIYIPIEVMYS